MDEKDAKIAALEEELRRLKAQPVAVETGGGAAVMGNAQSGGDFVGGDKWTVVVSDALLSSLGGDKPPADLREATRQYLLFLLDRHRYLSLKGMGVSDRVPLQLPLLDLYVPLKARLEMPPGETWDRSLRLAGRELSEDEQQLLASRLGEPQSVLGLLEKHDGLVILGDPGAGKTTFLKYLTLKLARGEGEALGLGERLPILAPLSVYANALERADVRLDDFIADYFHTAGVDQPVKDLLAGALERGAALVLLDGLDEVRRSGLRHTVVERVVDFFTAHRRAGNKFVLTSRIVGYREVRPSATGLGECMLVDFDDDEIAGFVDRWTAAIEKQAQGDNRPGRADAERERTELLEAARGNPGVRRLAANPLLLTILVLMKRQGIALPERRVELYDQYVKTLLSSWNRARGLGRPPSRDLDPVQTIKVLAPLALWMHEVNPDLGVVKREDLRRELEALYAGRGEQDPEDRARLFLEDVREYAGLLLERGPGEYGFIHLTFEEYFAGVAIALRGQGDAEVIARVLGECVGDRLSAEGFDAPDGRIELAEGYTARLSMEQEWERAARGTDGREYPWGKNFASANTNVAEDFGKGIGTTVVCTYPQGVSSPLGAWDMGGNIFEWTSPRVLRGGSWYLPVRAARCAYRDVYEPVYRSSYVGFRVVVSLVSGY